jgi:mono/diheme cytochrome c family protein
MKNIIFILLLIPYIANAAPLRVKFTDLPAPVSIADGKKLYQENGCPLCHGNQGLGDGLLAGGLNNKPRNFKDYQEMKRMPTIRMEQAIRHGLEGTAMQPFTHFSDSEVNALIIYLRSFLADSYADLKMCAFQTYHINVNNLDKPFRVEVDEPGSFESEVREKIILLRGKNWTDLLNKKKQRTHFRLMQDDRIVSLISVKISHCQKEMNEMLKNLTPGKI